MLNTNDYVIVRTYSAGVFAGTLKHREGKEVTLTNARCIWYWDGAASLTQLAQEGPQKPKNCKFTMPVSEVLVLEAIEILAVSSDAKIVMDGIPSWKK